MRITRHLVRTLRFPVISSRQDATLKPDTICPALGVCAATLALPAGAEVDFSLTASQEVSLVADYNSLHIYRVRKANV